MDTSFKSNQPFIYQEKTRTIIFVCNGEIYNFKELIEEFELSISGNSDCKTIPELYRVLGYDGFCSLFDSEIKGEFAFCMFEFDIHKNLRKIIAGRDQVGIRPLYYHNPTKSSELIMFSSEIKGMTSFEDKIEEFPPGKIVKFEIDEFGKLERDEFDFVNYIPDDFIEDTSEKSIINSIRTSVINAVRRRLDADRPLAFLLSGGIDSSIVCAVAQKILKVPIKTYCCGMKEGTDILFARKVAEFIGSSHTEVFFTPEEGLTSIDEVIYATETWDTTTIRASVGQFMVCKYIGQKTDAKVVLVGEGPDEVCSSYMFNWYAPTGKALSDTAKKYVKEIHMYDGRRADRCISYWGLEGRVPLLDPEFIHQYWEIPDKMRHPKYKGIEKYYLRKAFEDILPKEVVWRTKEAFSDGVSSKEKSWYEIIQDHILEKIGDKDWTSYPSPEAFYYAEKFNEFFPNKKNVLPHYWQPKWKEDGTEVSKYIDPSARVLDVYNKK
ncbi:MAG: hypothetical protein CMF62_02210 [Magnetococcales bacterium]|nr:hypothetical protein [Magnetococcales bacterium]